MRQFIQFSILVILYPKMFLQQNHKDINIGFAVEYGKSLDKTKWLDGSMDEAISDINNDPKLLPGYTLKKFVVNSGCNAHLSAGGISKLIREDNVDVIIGPSCSEGCEPCGHLATFHNLTMISYGCSSVLLSDTTIYPTFARTRSYARSSEKLLSKFLYKFLDSMDWRRVALVHSSASKWTLIKNKLDEQLRLDNLTITLDKDFSSNPASVVNHIVTSGSRSKYSVIPVNSRAVVT